MRILDNKTKFSLKDISMFLEKSEIYELRDIVEDLINNIDNNDYHLHFNDENFLHEISFAIYSKENVACFNKRVQQLLIEDI